MTKSTFYTWSFLLALFSVFALPAWGGVRVEEDEVIFNVRAPGARQVFLVGDFNNWNPTVEKMVARRDSFETSLFLVEGTYRYKFVIDGRWMADPDNAPENPELGSLLVLKERGGRLFIKSPGLGGGGGGGALEPSGRCIGRLRWEEGEFISDHEIDFNLSGGGELVRSSAVFKTRDDSWKLSPFGGEVSFDRGHLEVSVGSGKVIGFENDTLWSSKDPFGLIGNVGIYGYKFGFGTKGIALSQPLIFKTKLRLVYSDNIRETPSELLRIPAEELLGFKASTSPDTLVYENGVGFEDEDMMGLELFLETERLELGYVKRINRGLHPGLMVGVHREDSLFLVAASNTREYWDASALWLRSDLREGIVLSLAYGRGRARVRALSRSVSLGDLSDDITLGGETSPAAKETPFERSLRWMVAAEMTRGAFCLLFSYEGNRFDFDRPLYEPSRAFIKLASLGFEWHRRRWKAWGGLRYTDQDYGETPPAFHIDLPGRNLWLDYGDGLTVYDLVGFDARVFTQFFLSAVRQFGGGFSKNLEGFEKVGGARVDLGAAARNILRGAEYAFVRVGAERFLRKRLYLGLDSRAALYRKSSWGVDRGFVSFYFEVGYRSENTEASIGMGFDPVVFDRVRNGYYDIGRVEFLRRSVGNSMTRQEGSALGRRLMDLEESLQDNRTLKLEWIVLF